MSIRFIKGDATRPQLETGHNLLVHVVNNEGKFSAGFAHSLGMRYPGARRAYLDWYDGYTAIHGVAQGTRIAATLGQVWPYRYNDHLTILHLCAQDGLRKYPGHRVLNYETLRTCLFKVRCYAQQIGGATIHMPRMGAGLAGGDWRVVESIVHEQLCDFDIPVIVYDYQPR